MYWDLFSYLNQFIYAENKPLKFHVSFFIHFTSYMAIKEPAIIKYGEKIAVY